MLQLPFDNVSTVVTNMSALPCRDRTKATLSYCIVIDNGAYPLRSIIYAVVVLSYDGIFVSRACLNAMLYCGYAYRLLYYILSLSCVLAESQTLHLLLLLLYSNGDALLFW